MSKFVVSVR